MRRRGETETESVNKIIEYSRHGCNKILRTSISRLCYGQVRRSRRRRRRISSRKNTRERARPARYSLTASPSSTFHTRTYSTTTLSSNFDGKTYNTSAWNALEAFSLAQRRAYETAQEMVIVQRRLNNRARTAKISKSDLIFSQQVCRGIRVRSPVQSRWDIKNTKLGAREENGTLRKAFRP